MCLSPVPSGTLHVVQQKYLQGKPPGKEQRSQPGNKLPQEQFLQSKTAASLCADTGTRGRGQSTVRSSPPFTQRHLEQGLLPSACSAPGTMATAGTGSPHKRPRVVGRKRQLSEWRSFARQPGLSQALKQLVRPTQGGRCRGV